MQLTDVRLSMSKWSNAFAFWFNNSLIAYCLTLSAMYFFYDNVSDYFVFGFGMTWGTSLAENSKWGYKPGPEIIKANKIMFRLFTWLLPVAFVLKIIS